MELPKKRISRWFKLASRVFSRSKPDFLIIGAQKCGTTSLHSILSQHPQLVPPNTKKELQFFERREITFRNKLALKAQFPLMAWKKKCYESSPNTIWIPAAKWRVKKFNPDMKLIVILREPSERALSHFSFHVGKTHSDLEFHPFDLEKKLEDAQGYITRGFYHEQISHWLSEFPVEQFLFIKYEALFSLDFQQQMNNVTSVLNIPEFDFKIEHKNKVMKKASFKSESLKSELKHFYESKNSGIAEITGFDWY